METKICGKCGEEKPFTLEFFSERSDTKRLRSECKVCRREYQRQYHKKNYEENKERYMEKAKEWYKENRERKQEKCKEWYKENKDAHKENGRKWYEENKERRLEKCKEWHKNNLGKASEYSKRWRDTNREKAQASQRDYYKRNKEKRLAYHKEYIRTNINANIAKKLRVRVWQALKGRATPSSSTLEVLGCSIETLKKQFTSQFREGMTWEKFMSGEIHIDHIIPCSSFNLEDPEEQKRCFHCTNLQPLWAEDNLKKSAKLDYVI